MHSSVCGVANAQATGLAPFSEFFAVIQRNKHNFVARLKNLVALTKNGHNIAPFEVMTDPCLPGY